MGRNLLSASVLAACAAAFLSCGGTELDCDTGPTAQNCCNDDAQGLQSRLQPFLSAGQTITIVVTGYLGSVGNFVLNIDYGPLSP